MTTRAQQIAALRQEIADLDKPQAATPAPPHVEASKPEAKVVDQVPTFDDLRSRVRAARAELQAATHAAVEAHQASVTARSRVSAAQTTYDSALEALAEAA